MNRLIKYTAACAAVLCAASCTSEDFEETYGNGSPLAENIVGIPHEPYSNTYRYKFEYNENGLVSRILEIKNSGSVEPPAATTEVVAEISYPESNRAVMVCHHKYYNPPYTVTHVFAFGENHFANRIISTNDADGETDTWMTKCTYDSEGHLTSYDSGEDKLRLEWTGGNITKIKQQEYNASAELTYGDGTDFKAYGLSPFLLDVDLGPFMYDLEWWFDDDLHFALYMGFLGKPCRNLPTTLLGRDSENDEPYRGRFDYGYLDTGEGHVGYWGFSQEDF